MDGRPPGWYAAATPGRERFWDGARWTGEVRPTGGWGPGEDGPDVVLVAPEEVPWRHQALGWIRTHRRTSLILVGFAVAIVALPLMVDRSLPSGIAGAGASDHAPGGPRTAPSDTGSTSSAEVRRPTTPRQNWQARVETAGGSLIAQVAQALDVSHREVELTIERVVRSCALLAHDAPLDERVDAFASDFPDVVANQGRVIEGLGVVVAAVCPEYADEHDAQVEP
ncbi:DUF2510 domain-containing protein [Nocardioides sp. R-C-SC26]|uniref:DUF2510 domain-containing protein n=1 Tax=Nocardioides sp. R-C-SC26 TaxID=2870414 RepID=UPI001E3AE401|nr:DUF2510 domain-containing protein [Nocardioides sp. R-C-SC26]